MRNLPSIFTPRHQDEIVVSFSSYLDHILNDFFQDFRDIKPADIKNQSYPKCDIYRDNKNLVIHAAVPFVEKEDLSVTIEDGVITIAGKAKAYSESKADGINDDSKQYLLSELKASHFIRSFMLEKSHYESWAQEDYPREDHEGKMTAELKDGILTITLKDFYESIMPKSKVKRKLEIT